MMPLLLLYYYYYCHIDITLIFHYITFIIDYISLIIDTPLLHYFHYRSLHYAIAALFLFR
jgi:hypothetical protein